jgi:hypothetical protein
MCLQYRSLSIRFRGRSGGWLFGTDVHETTLMISVISASSMAPIVIVVDSVIRFYKKKAGTPSKRASFVTLAPNCASHPYCQPITTALRTNIFCSLPPTCVLWGMRVICSGIVNTPLTSIAQDLGYPGDSMLMGLTVRPRN